MVGLLDIATFAYRLTVEGAEEVDKKINSTFNKAAQGAKGLKSSGDAATAALTAVSNRLSGMEKHAVALEKLKRQLIAIAGVGGLALLVNKSLEAQIEVKKLASETGFAVVPFQELVFALKQYNVEQGDAVAAMRRFSAETAHFVSHNSGPAKDAYYTLFGANAQAIAQQGLGNIDQFFLQVLNRIGNLKNEAQKLDLLRQIFTKEAGPALLEAANAGAEALERQMQTAQQLGIVFSKDMVDGADDAKDKIEVLADVLRTKLYVALGQNADQIAKFADFGLENLPTVMTLFSGIAKVVESTAISLGNIAGITQWLLTPRLTGNDVPEFGEVMKNLQDPQAPWKDGAASGSNTPWKKGGAAGGGAAGGSGNKLTIGNDEAVAAAKRQQEAYERLTYSLQQELEMVGKTERQTFILNEQRKLGAKATDAQREAIEQLAGKVYDEQEAWNSLKGAMEQAGDAGAQALKDIAFGCADADDALKKLGSTLLDIAYKMLIADPAKKGMEGLLGGIFSGGINMFGSGGGSLTSAASTTGGLGSFDFLGSFGGFKAGGGPLDQNKWYIAGEYGPEPVWGGGPGAFAAGYGGGDGVNVVVQDMAGVNVSARRNGKNVEIRLTQLEDGLEALNRSVDGRAVQAVQNARMRSTNF